MEMRFTRRQFGQLAVVSTTAAGLSYLANRAVAQTTPMLYGVTASSSLPASRQARKSGVTLAGGLVVQSFDLAKNSQQTIPLNATPQIPAIQGETIHGFTSLTDGTLVLATTPLVSSKGVEPSRVALFSPTAARLLPLVGLSKTERIASLLGLNEGDLLAVIGPRIGTGLYRLANLDPKTGRLSAVAVTLPKGQPIGNLTRCRTGAIYATATSSGGVRLIQLNGTAVTSIAPLQIGKQRVGGGVRSLACAPDGRLLALYAARYSSQSAIYDVDLKTGLLTRVSPFTVAKIAFV
jgi:hypothetical protein